MNESVALCFEVTECFWILHARVTGTDGETGSHQASLVIGAAEEEIGDSNFLLCYATSSALSWVTICKHLLIACFFPVVVVKRPTGTSEAALASSPICLQALILAVKESKEM